MEDREGKGRETEPRLYSRGEKMKGEGKRVERKTKQRDRKAELEGNAERQEREEKGAGREKEEETGEGSSCCRMSSLSSSLDSSREKNNSSDIRRIWVVEVAWLGSRALPAPRLVFSLACSLAALWWERA